VADLSSIASLATAGGTLVLAVATFSATRSANRSARVAEHALQAGLRPVIFNARPEDPPQKVGFIDDHWVVLRNGLAALQLDDDNVYLSVPVRNVGAGLAVIHGWHLWLDRTSAPPPPTEEFRAHARDLYIPAGDIGFWQAALRDHEDDLYEQVREQVTSRAAMSLDILYGDHEGGQRTITRLLLAPRMSADEEPWLWQCSTGRHWNLDRAEPRSRAA
jgi:hypothetical protein